MKVTDQNGISAIVSLLVNKHGAKQNPIDHGNQYVSKTELKCNIFNTGTISIQNAKADPGLEKEIISIVGMWQ